MLRRFAAFNVILYFSYEYLWLWQQTKISSLNPLHWYLFTIGAGVVFILAQFWVKFRVPRGSSLRLMLWGLTAAAMT